MYQRLLEGIHHNSNTSCRAPSKGTAVMKEEQEENMTPFWRRINLKKFRLYQGFPGGPWYIDILLAHI